KLTHRSASSGFLSVAPFDILGGLYVSRGSDISSLSVQLNKLTHRSASSGFLSVAPFDILGGLYVSRGSDIS
ncbi:hypothetical protein QWT36_23865, partial [Salmonella enterica subsp. enterica serovar Typhi]|nr:hypothetical protein [Salmonella enterica subsp. enterica serovar Typhi]